MNKNEFSLKLKDFINLKIDKQFSKRSDYAKKIVKEMSYNYAYRLQEEKFQFCPNLYIWYRLAEALDTKPSVLLEEFEKYIGSD